MKHLKSFTNLFEAQNVGRFKILPNGDLEISLDSSEDREDMEKFQGDDDQFLWEFFEKELTNGFNLVGADHKGLTEAPVIADGVIDDETTEEDMKNTKVWYYDNYQITGVQQVLLKDGKIVFTKHHLNEE